MEYMTKIASFFKTPAGKSLLASALGSLILMFPTAHSFINTKGPTPELDKSDPPTFIVNSLSMGLLSMKGPEPALEDYKLKPPLWLRALSGHRPGQIKPEAAVPAPAVAAAQSSTPSSQAAAIDTGLKLSDTFQDGSGKWLALIGNDLYEPGKTVNGYEIVQIQSRQATLKKNGRNYLLTSEGAKPV